MKKRVLYRSLLPPSSWRLKRTAQCSTALAPAVPRTPPTPFTAHIRSSALSAATHPGLPGRRRRFLAERIADVGVRHWFGVPGDFNLSLLDELLNEKRLKMVSTCNELNGGCARLGAWVRRIGYLGRGRGRGYGEEAVCVPKGGVEA